MAVTLVEAAKQTSGDVKRSAVIEMFARNSPLLQRLTWMNIPGAVYSYNKEGKLPSLGFRGINDPYTDKSIGILNPESEALKILGKEIEVDGAMIKMYGPSVRTQQELMVFKAAIHKTTSKIINGDSIANPLEYDGLRRRVVGGQLFSATGDNTNGALRLEMLDAAIDAVPGANGIICNKAFARKLTKAAKNRDIAGGDITYGKDQFGQRVAEYNSIPLIIVERDEDEREIIDFNEVGPAGAGAGADCMSAYVANFGDGKFHGIQNGILEVEDLGKMQSKNAFLTRFEWLASIAVPDGRAVARIRGITNADFVA